jgi:hypothetical protein
MRKQFGTTRAHGDGAEHRAGEEGRRLVDRSPHFSRGRANHVNNRVNVLFDDEGIVVMADLG